MLSFIRTHYRQCRHDAAFFIGSFILYGMNEWWFKHLGGSAFRFFNGYYNDILAPVILLSYSNILITVLAGRVYLGFAVLSVFILSAGLFWEYVTPLYKHSTPDPYDIVMYYAGFLVYWAGRKWLVRAWK